MTTATAHDTAPTLSSLLHTGEASRSCVVCKKELTDAASVESGIGPVCRKRSNEALARAISANVQNAKDLCYIAREKGLLATGMSQVQPTVDSIINAIIMDPAAHTRTDWRHQIGQMAWVLSHEHLGGKFRCLMHDLAEALGYTATVALWRGEVVVGKCQVVFDPCTRTITTHSPRPNEAVRDAMKGAGFRYNPTDKSWFAPASNLQYLATLERCIATYFLGADLSPFQVARDWFAANKVKPQPSPEPKQTTVRLVRSGVDTITIFAPYRADFVAALKAQIPAWARVWSGADKAWMIHLDHLPTLRSLCSSIYGYQGEVETV